MTKCRRCNRELKNPVAIELGIGPVCAKKAEAAIEKLRTANTLGPSPAECKKIICKRIEGRPYVNIAQTVERHSPDGFEWGYGGSGPAELALNICRQILINEENYQAFKSEFIATMPREGGEIQLDKIYEWAKKNQSH